MKRLNLLFGSLAMVALIATAGAQTWDETVNGGGDTGDHPITAQVVTGSGPLTRITGNHGDSDVDMYVILICDPLNFSATTVGGATFDTQLFLFREDGRGALHNDDDPSGSGTRSAIGNPHNVYSNGAFVASWSAWVGAGNLPAGLYYLAISRYNRDPLSDPLSGGLPIWADIPYGLQRIPDGPNPGGYIDSWTGTTSAGGAYTIFLTGTCFVPEPASTVALGAGLAGLLGLRRRKK